MSPFVLPLVFAILFGAVLFDHAGIPLATTVGIGGFVFLGGVLGHWLSKRLLAVLGIATVLVLAVISGILGAPLGIATYWASSGYVAVIIFCRGIASPMRRRRRRKRYANARRQLL